MTEAPPTRASLLVRLRDAQDAAAWTAFVDLYAPAIYGYARKQGLQDADAADLTQTVLLKVSSHIAAFDYDPQRGSFRGWLFTIVRRLLHDSRARREDASKAAGDTKVRQLLNAVPTPVDGEDEWEREYRRSLFHWAAERVRSRTNDVAWQAFWRTSVEGEPAASAAQQLGVSIAAVYLARSRVIARLREEIQTQIDES